MSAFEFRGEREPAPALVEEDRFDSEVVARERQLPGALVVDRERPHPAKAAKRTGSPTTPPLQYDLRVRLRAKSHTLSLQLLAQGLVVVELTVVDQHEFRL